MTYVIYAVAPDGESCDPEREEFETIDEARAEAYRRLGDLDNWRRWGGFEPAEESGLDDCPGALSSVEAYHESRAEGCGWIQISRK